MGRSSDRLYSQLGQLPPTKFNPQLDDCHLAREKGLIEHGKQIRMSSASDFELHE